MANEGRLIADKNLESDINKTTNYEDLRALLDHAVERSGIAARDPYTGRFTTTTESSRTTPSTEQTTREYKKSVMIGGQEFEFTSTTQEGLDLQVESAQTVARELFEQQQQENQEAHAAAQAAQRSLQVARGEKTPAQALAESAGVSLDDIAETVIAHKNAEYVDDWGKAVNAFLNGPGADYPGGEKNMQLMQMTVAKLGLENAEDKVGALVVAFNDMKRNGLVMPNDSDEAVMKQINDLTPREILELYKSGFQNSDAANAHFIESLRKPKFGNGK